MRPSRFVDLAAVLERTGEQCRPQRLHTRRVDVRATVDGRTVVIEIEDDGPGIPETDRETLFEHVGKNGTDHGLGLSIVATLATRYGGEVELTETGPTGTTITIRLPVADHGPTDPQRVFAPDAVSAPTDTSGPAPLEIE
ncbi:ATP-binding protein [Halobaculum sp. MBLA0147]|uniref:ATP-binding protein n=1 Tax=Halobaculum sp. MBLA0147 TaxID=3079934 RepID=UPI003523A439